MIAPDMPRVGSTFLARTQDTHRQVSAQCGAFINKKELRLYAMQLGAKDMAQADSTVIFRATRGRYA